MGKKAIARQKKRERAALQAAAGPESSAQPPESALELQGPRGSETMLADPTQIATQLNSVAIHLVRRLHREDAGLGLSGARLSALSVLVFGGARTIGRLAEAEGVTPPSMTRLVAAMEAEGLVQRRPSPTDARSVMISATPGGEGIMLRGREQRVVALAGWLSTLAPGELGTIRQATELLREVLAGQAQGRRHHT
jgi:DNA-binding MarR family transcriptional regulator